MCLSRFCCSDLLLRYIFRCHLLLACSRNLQNFSAPLTSPSFRVSGTFQVNQYPALLAEIHPARPNSRLQI
jgi:hypothetical protein